ncbi:radical SAM protein [Candidatus Thorarchaeota archaeon]|nr:MAG: radical SAM protein [Candidatus Thorarchaeota archaeon]
MGFVVRIVLLDGYVDEPTCLGVPPYISTYPRYIAGAIWSVDSRIEILYQTIDEVRLSFQRAQETWAHSDLLILIAGMVVPGKYLGGTPISPREARELFSDSRLERIPKVLVGPWGRFGCGLEGGRPALSPESLSPPFDHILRGDPEVVIYNALREGCDFSRVDLAESRSSARQIEPFLTRGAQIVRQHPNYERNYLICEIETYRGCPRYVVGGCSFCIEPNYGPPQTREAADIASEIQALYSEGIRAFRLGRQSDIFSYGSREMGEDEFPTPSVSSIRSLFSRIRTAAPDIQVLHIDNVNPGTIAHHPEESKQVAKTIMKYHTVGDVAAFGIESLDPEVIRRNNLKVNPDEAYEAVATLNEVGAQSPPRELPHLLPGINLVYGLPGESDATLEHNLSFLERLRDEGLLVRRINIRQVIGLPGTALSDPTPSTISHSAFLRHKKQIREEIDTVMLQRVAPAGTIIRSAFLEAERGKNSLLRPLASYPLLCHMPGRPSRDVTDVVVTDHGPRSVTVLPHPFPINSASMSQLGAIPGIGSKRAARLKLGTPWRNITHIHSQLDIDIPSWLQNSIEFEDKQR